jgi:hypothetical protein
MIVPKDIKVELTLKHQGRVRTYQHSTGSGASNWSRAAFRVDSNVTAEDNGVPTIPTGAFDPIDSIEDSSSRTVASVFGIDTLDIGVAVHLKKIHQDSLDGLGFINDGFGAHVKAAN